MTNRAVPLLLGVVASGFVIAGFGHGIHLPNLHNGLLGFSETAVALYVLAFRPHQRMGWLFLVAGFSESLMFFCRQHGYNPTGSTAAEWLAWFGVWSLPLVILLGTPALMCFPDGKLPSPRWGIPLGVLGLVAVSAAICGALGPGGYENAGVVTAFPFDSPFEETAVRLWPMLSIPAFQLLQLLWVASAVFRLRRAQGAQRHQLAWFVYSVVVAGAIMVGGLLVVGNQIPGVLAASVVPVVAGIAIVRHRLYDIEPVISKTLVATLMAALVTAAYVVLVLGVGRFAADDQRPILSVAAVGLIAVAFDPLRRRVTRLADRIVYGHRTDPYSALAWLSGDHQQTDLLTALTATIGQGIGARAVRIEATTGFAAQWPPGPQSENSHEIPVIRDDHQIGTIAFDKPRGHDLTKTEKRLLGDLVAQAGLVIEHVGLARRLVSAHDEARRRIERDLHDGAQQRLVTLNLSLGELSRALPPEYQPGVNSARGELREALAELREMARGIHPAILVESGLAGALEYLADRSPVPVSLEVDIDDRLPAETEACAYFVASESLTNAFKHTRAEQTSISARRARTALVVTISDNGIGGTDIRAGGGIQGISDRLAAVGGSLTVRSTRGAGTTIEAVIPCAQ